MTGDLTEEIVDRRKKLLMKPDFGNIFDELYQAGLGFKNEKLLQEKLGGKHLFY
ncbi:hypothetical protein D3C87_2126860 [compost metagenome]